MKRILTILGIILLLAAPAMAAQVTTPWTFAAGQSISATKFNDNFDVHRGGINEIETDQIKDSTILGADIAQHTIQRDNLAVGLAGSFVIGAITQYAGDSQTDTLTSEGWFICTGQALSRTTYSALYSVIGTKFGVGDGATTFNVPDFRDRVAIGANSGTIAATVVEDTRSMRVVGDTGGVESHKLTVAEMPSHNGHSPNAISLNTTSGLGQVVASPDNLSYGSSQPHTNLQPYIVVNYIIYAGTP